MEDDAFLRALAANPDDDTIRLAYADWLEEHGDRRGEFLRAAVAARNAADQSDWPEKLRRLVELRPAATPAWLRRVHRALADDAVREVVFRWLLDHKPGFDTFVRVENGRDPSPYLFALVKERSPEVQPASTAELRDGAYLDKRSGLSVEMVSIDALEWVAEDRCNVVGSDFLEGLVDRSNRYRVGVERGWWRVLDVSSVG